MKERESEFYRLLYKRPRSKPELAELFGVSTKTVDNTAAKLSSDIVYDRKIGAYRFARLLPKRIPLDTLLETFSDLFEGKKLAPDLALAGKVSSSETLFVDTAALTPFSKNILKAEVAIGSNCVITIEYGGIDKSAEKKTIRPHKVFSYGGAIYLHASYDPENGKNVGETRTFAFTGIRSIEPVRFVPSREGSFCMEGTFSPYGKIDREVFAMLRISGRAAGYFKREQLFDSEQYRFLSEEADGSILAKMYYSNEDQLSRLVQQWMPFIEILGDVDLRDRIYREILTNVSSLMGEGP